MKKYPYIGEYIHDDHIMICFFYARADEFGIWGLNNVYCIYDSKYNHNTDRVMDFKFENLFTKIS